MNAVIKGIEYCLPTEVLSNEQLAVEYPEWTAAKIKEKTGIQERHITSEGECASDLGVKACKQLFDKEWCRPEDIDYLILCTQSPDHFLPTTACLMQDRLGIPTHAGAIDVNLGCSGFIYCLGLAKGLIDTGQAQNVLVVTAETYSKHIHPGDRSVRTLFGDAAAATLVGQGKRGSMGPFVYGTDGRGGGELIVPSGGSRMPRSLKTAQVVQDDQGNSRALDNLYMNGPEIFTFTLKSVPPLVKTTLLKAGLDLEGVDHVVLHQANQYMLESLRKKMKIPEEKFVISFADCGNTVSSTIPIALKNKLVDGSVKPGQKLLLVGFGVGFSWGAALVEWA